MPIQDSKTLVSIQGYVLCINPKSLKHIIDIRGMSVFECPGDFLDLNRIQDEIS